MLTLGPGNVSNLITITIYSYRPCPGPPQPSNIILTIPSARGPWVGVVVLVVLGTGQSGSVQYIKTQ